MDTHFDRRIKNNIAMYGLLLTVLINAVVIIVALVTMNVWVGVLREERVVQTQFNKETLTAISHLNTNMALNTQRIDMLERSR